MTAYVTELRQFRLFDKNLTDGRHVAIVLNSTPPPYAGHPNPNVYLVPTDGSGKLRNLTPDNPHIDAAPHFSPDGKAVLFTRQQLPTIAGELQRLWRIGISNVPSVPRLFA